MTARSPTVTDALASPEAWPGRPDVIVRTTHISVVFLVGDRAYKLKRPVDYGFLDYSTLEKRKYFCEEEVRINGPRAPGVYLDVVAVRQTPEGPRIGARDGEIVDWAVEMRRLRDEDSLLSRVERGLVDPALLRRIGERLARLHAEAERTAEIASFGARAVLQENVDENFAQIVPDVGVAVSAPVVRRLRELQHAALAEQDARLRRRVARGVPCDCHGDLRLEHVYLLGDEIAFVDAIEFNSRFRYGDPALDLAFLVMDLAVRGYREEADELVAGWLRMSHDTDALALLPLYVSYRSTVRGKIAAFRMRDCGPDATTFGAAHLRSRRHWLFAYAELAPPRERPCLVALAGLPGTGKSTLAERLAPVGGFEVIRTDVVRKEAENLGYEGLAKDEVYARCFALAEKALFEGKRVLLDAGLWHARRRAAVHELARGLGVESVILWCQVDDELARERLRARTGDASDADESVYDLALEAWEPDHGEMIPLDTSDNPLPAALTALREARLPLI